MGALLSRLYYYREKKVIILGLDNSGKSTILSQLLKYPKKRTIREPYMPPTLGFNMQKTTFKNRKYSLWDLSGNNNIRKYWKCYFTGCNGVIFVVDTADIDRIDENLSILGELVSDEELKQAAIFSFFAQV
ncbi:GTP-binding ADP-ribosylation factor Arf6 (dArf3) [Trachipleistophora hominis]|uniref:GTP-binding ADP-ribosylation factor Arf6 (DArf3) n=1 Tax=Trachipleistophora hominis TaxID=72359 RepID=L7JTU6_TRAHO|nr:GTP-binding ADP-ribosylation factor Arf6 (dArf3) [Trachipleistophora hominis]